MLAIVFHIIRRNANTGRYFLDMAYGGRLGDADVAGKLIRHRISIYTKK